MSEFNRGYVYGVAASVTVVAAFILLGWYLSQQDETQPRRIILMKRDVPYASPNTP